MVDEAMLVIGLGKTGHLGARHLKALLSTREKKTCEIRVFDLEESRGESNGIGIDYEKFHLMSGVDARQMLRNAKAWSSSLNWLPPGIQLREIDEIARISGGGQRWLGRSSFFAADSAIQNTIRTSLARLHQRSGVELERVALIASVGGGTGSGILADITYLVDHLAQHASRAAYLLLPGIGTNEPLRSRANAYATLKEIYSLKYQSMSFEANYPYIGERSVPCGEGEPWQRLYICSPSEGEEPPYLETIQRMALAVSAQIREDVRSHSIAVSQREVEFVEYGNSQSPRADFCFSTCRLLQEQDPIGGILSMGERAVGFSVRSELPGGRVEILERTEGREGQHGGIGESELLLLFDSHAGSAVSEAAKEIILKTEEDLRKIEELSHDLSEDDARREVTGLECAIREVEAKLSIEKTPAIPISWWKKLWRNLSSWWGRLRSSQELKKHAKEAIDTSSKLPGWEEAQELVRRGWQDYLLAVSAAERKDGGRAIADKYKERKRVDAIHIAESSEGYAAALAEHQKLVSGGYEKEIKNRCATLRAIVEDKAFRQLLEF